MVFGRVDEPRDTDPETNRECERRIPTCEEPRRQQQSRTRNVHQGSRRHDGGMTTAEDRPIDPTPVHTVDLPATPQRDRTIPATAWIEAPAALLDSRARPRSRARRVQAPDRAVVALARRSRGEGERALRRARGRRSRASSSPSGCIRRATVKASVPTASCTTRFRAWKEALRDTAPAAETRSDTLRAHCAHTVNDDGASGGARAGAWKTCSTRSRPIESADAPPARPRPLRPRTRRPPVRERQHLGTDARRRRRRSHERARRRRRQLGRRPKTEEEEEEEEVQAARSKKSGSQRAPRPARAPARLRLGSSLELELAAPRRPGRAGTATPAARRPPRPRPSPATPVTSRRRTTRGRHRRAAHRRGRAARSPGAPRPPTGRRRRGPGCGTFAGSLRLRLVE